MNETLNVPSAAAVAGAAPCSATPLWSLCRRSIKTNAFGRIDGYHLFENPNVALCGQQHDGAPFLTAAECTRPGLPVHCAACEDAPSSPNTERSGGPNDK